MIRKASVMKLHEGKALEYERRHTEIWPEMVELLKKAGAHNYSIYLDPLTNVLFSYVEIEDEKRWGEKAETEICRRWWDYMADIMEVNADNSPAAENLKEVFYLK